MFKITKDHLAPADEVSAAGAEINQMPLYGMERAMGVDDALPNEGPTIRFRLYDDDNTLLYSGVLTDDEDCDNQQAALRWGESDAGATIIKVWRDGKFVQEIG